MDRKRPETLTRGDLWKLLLMQSALFLGLGALLLWWNGIRVQLRLPDLKEVLLAVALTAPLLLSSLLLLRLSAGYNRSVELLERVLGPPMRTRDIPALAAISAAVEEFLFRGVLQPLLGLGAAAAVFGLAHVWNRRLLAHGLWAIGAGLYLGVIYTSTDNLSVPILIHAMHNLVGLSLLKRGDFQDR